MSAIGGSFLQAGERRRVRERHTCQKSREVVIGVWSLLDRHGPADLLRACGQHSEAKRDETKQSFHTENLARFRTKRKRHFRTRTMKNKTTPITIVAKPVAASLGLSIAAYTSVKSARLR